MAPSLVLLNGRIWSGDPARPEAEALAIEGSRIAAVGSTANVKAGAGNADVVDLRGQFVTPGFVDAHVHFIEGGFRLTSVQLRDARTPEEFTRRIEAFAATVPAGTWIIGGDWDHTLWGGELPRRGWVDAATRDHPVWVSRLDGHMALAGLLKDNAMALVEGKAPRPTDEMKDRALDAAMRYVNAQGVTTVHNMGTWDDLAVFARAWRAHRLTTRVYAVVPLNTWEQLWRTVEARTYGPEGHGDEWLRVGGLKGFVDGSLGSHTAAFRDPFADAPNDRGLFVNTPEDLYEWISNADEHHLQVMVHAIGDRAIGTLLDIYERVAAEDGARDRRFRVEHAQHLAPADIPRFHGLGVIASMQPYHAIDDGRWAERAIGRERIETTYAFRSLLDADAALAFGSDWFVAPPTPIEGIYAAVT